MAMTEPSTTRAPEPDDALHAALDAEQVVERYLLGRLDDEEARRFERHYLDCPTCLERLEANEGLIEGMRQAASEDALRQAVSWSLAAFLTRLGPWRPIALAAALLLVLVPAGWLGWRAVRLGAEVEGLRERLAAIDTPRVDPWMISLATERGSAGDGESSRELRRPDEERLIVLTLELGLEPGARYGLELEGAEGQALWRSDLRADPAGQLVLALSSEFLPLGELALVVTDPAGEPTARLPLRVVEGS